MFHALFTVHIYNSEITLQVSLSPVSMSSGKHREKKKSNFFGFPQGFCMDFLRNQTRMNFFGSQMGATMARTDPENIGSKKKQFFGFPWGFCMDFLENQTRMNFSGNRMGAAAARTDPKNTRSKKKAYNISEISEIKDNFENVNMNNKQCMKHIIFFSLPSKTHISVIWVSKTIYFPFNSL